jgi:sulfite reductase (NADPH) flavoprotein alpha-component
MEGRPAKRRAFQAFDSLFARPSHKIYVQHRIMEEGQEFWNWLEEGGIFYVCGDKTAWPPMYAALHQVVERFGGKSGEEAKAYVEAMKKSIVTTATCIKFSVRRRPVE